MYVYLLHTEEVPWPMTIGVMIAAPVVFVTKILRPSLKVEHAIELVANLWNLLSLTCMYIHNIYREGSTWDFPQLIHVAESL